jgi:hypothetical protein
LGGGSKVKVVKEVREYKIDGEENIDRDL